MAVWRMITPGENRIGSAAPIVEFCRFAQSKGISIGMQQTLAAVAAAGVIGVAEPERLWFALRAALCSSRKDWDRFAKIYEEFWSGRRNHPEVEAGPGRPAAATRQPDLRLLTGLDNATTSSRETEGMLIAGASTEQRLKKVDFAEASSADMVELEQLSLRLLRQMSARLSRRMKNDVKRNQVDIRRSIRRNVSRDGDLLVLAYKGRKRQKKRLTLLVDISGSMNLYSLFLVRFAYAMQKHFRRITTFLFATSVVEVSDLLRAPSLPKALSGISQKALEWSGGTNIGGSLRELSRLARERVLSRDTTLIILSDGWDTGPPEVLAAELRKARSRVHRTLWLNPLLGLKDYRPITRGMSAALPYVDVFAPANNLESLLALEEYL